MKKVFFMFVPILMALVSCSKDSINNSPNPITPASTQGYLVVKCDNCKIDYGMPDQYHGVNVDGASGNLSYTYKKGYNLQANIYALDRDQTLIYTVYDNNGKQIYNNSIQQSVEDYWQVNVLLP